MDNKIVLTTGIKKYQIINEMGDEVGVIAFNPTDMNLPRRFEEAEKRLQNMKVSDNPTFEEFYKVSDEVKKCFDYLLNTDSSEIFGKSNPLNILPDGSFYFVNVLNKIANIVNENVEERSKAFDKKIDEAVAKITNE